VDDATIFLKSKKNKAQKEKNKVVNREKKKKKYLKK
jgi:hypothetical protein